MTLDARMLLAGRGVEAPDWLGDAARASALSNLAQTRRLQMDAARRAEESQRTIGEALGQVDVTDDFQVRKALTTIPPESRQGFLTYVVEQRKKIADTRKDEAATDETRTKTKAAQYAIVGGIAGTLARQPTRESWQAAKATLQRLGMDPSVLDVPEGIEPAQHFAQIADGAMTRAQQLHVEDQAAGRRLTERGQDITVRGQDMTDARTREMTAAQLAQARALREGSWAQANATREAAAEQARATRDAANATAASGKINAETQALAKMAENVALPNLITSATALDNTLAKYKGRNIPGVGPIDSNLPPLLRGPEGNVVKSQVQAVANDLLKLYSGGAVTLNEAERRAVEMMSQGTFRDEDLVNAWPLIKGRINAAVQNVRAGFSPEAVQTYESRGGIKLQPIGAGGQPQGAPNRDQAIQEALDAIKKGAPRDKVLQRLREMGITDARI